MSLNFNKCFSLLVLFAVPSSLWNCTSETKPSPGAAPPAKVANGVKEADLATVTLSPQAEQRLGIETAKAEYRKVARTLRLGGEIMPVPGRHIFVTAPVTGVVIAPAGSLPQAGMKVRQGQPIFRLLPLPAERDLLGTPQEMALQKMQLEVARAKAARAEQLLLDQAGSVKAREAAAAEFASAEAAFKAAEARWHLTNNTAPDSVALTLATMAIAAPFEGVIQQINVAPRQTVSAGTELFEVMGQNPVWVRVPVYVGDLATIAAQQPAEVEALGSASGSFPHAAKAVHGPPLSHPSAASADLFFEMSNHDHAFRTGEKVSVTLAQKSAQENLIVPFSAILYDIHGGTWVYAKIAPQVYARRRVELRHVIDGVALLARGPAAGAEVVSTGAAEIFGTEFGGGK